MLIDDKDPPTPSLPWLAWLLRRLPPGATERVRRFLNRMAFEPGYHEQFVGRLVVRLSLVVPLGFAAASIYLAVNSSRVSGFVWTLSLVAALLVGRSRPLTGAAVAAGAGVLEWLARQHATGLMPLPPGLATLLVPTAVLCALELLQPSLGDTESHALEEAPFPRIILMVIPLAAAALVGWGTTLD